ncbi:MAG: hypothetical protein Q7S08_00250 [bacterium]|nr:hypothetical protein [bacterium]
MKINADFTKILSAEHEEKWVALSRDRQKVVDFDTSLPELRDRLGAKKSDCVYMKVLRSDVEYCFALSWEND